MKRRNDPWKISNGNVCCLALTWLRGSLEVHDEMDEMRAEYESMKLVPKTTLREMLTNQSLRAPLIIAVMMMLAQQFSGINAVIIPPLFLMIYLSITRTIPFIVIDY